MFRKLTSFTLILVVILSCLCTVSSAEEYIEKISAIFYKTSNDVYLWNAGYNPDTNTFDMKNATMDSGWKAMTCETQEIIPDIVSSNPSVAKVKILKDGGYKLWIKKTGSATLTYTIYGHKRIVDYTVLKYNNPCKSLKIGKTEYAGQFKKVPYIQITKTKKLSGKISVKPAKGWELESIRQGGAKQLQNNQKVNLKAKGSNCLHVTFRKAGTNYGCTVAIYIYP